MSSGSHAKNANAITLRCDLFSDKKDKKLHLFFQQKEGKGERNIRKDHCSLHEKYSK